MINQPVVDPIETKNFFDTVSYVLIENGFDIKMINETYGIISMEWRPVKSGADTAATILSAFDSSGSMTSYSRALMVQIQMTDTGYVLAPKLKRMSTTTSGFGRSSQENVDYPTPESHEGKLATKIVEEINIKLGLPNNYMWQEKVIEIGKDSY
jgi:uncharacterized lipoprotein